MAHEIWAHFAQRSKDQGNYEQATGGKQLARFSQTKQEVPASWNSAQYILEGVLEQKPGYVYNMLAVLVIKRADVLTSTHTIMAASFSNIFCLMNCPVAGV